MRPACEVHHSKWSSSWILSTTFTPHFENYFHSFWSKTMIRLMLSANYSSGRRFMYCQVWIPMAMLGQLQASAFQNKGGEYSVKLRQNSRNTKAEWNVNSFGKKFPRECKSSRLKPELSWFISSTGWWRRRSWAWAWNISSYRMDETEFIRGVYVLLEWCTDRDISLWFRSHWP